MKACYHGNRKNASYSFVLQHNKPIFGTRIYRISLHAPCKFHLCWLSNKEVISIISCCHGNKISLSTFFVHLLLSINENFKVKDQLIINWKDYCEIQVPQLSQSNWSNQFATTNSTYLASQLTD